MVPTSFSCDAPLRLNAAAYARTLICLSPIYSAIVAVTTTPQSHGDDDKKKEKEREKHIDEMENINHTFLLRR